MILSDASIAERWASGSLGIQPMYHANIQPASLDLTLGSHFRVMTRVGHGRRYIDPFENWDVTEECEVTNLEGLTILPGMFVLGTTDETLSLPNDLVGRVDGKSSLGRLGLMVHATAGFVDPGFSGQITLELSNVGLLPIVLYPGMAIAQISFMQMDRPTDTPYGHPSRKSKYQGQLGATASAYSRNDDIRTV